MSKPRTNIEKAKVLRDLVGHILDTFQALDMPAHQAGDFLMLVASSTLGVTDANGKGMTLAEQERHIANLRASFEKHMAESQRITWQGKAS